MATGAPVTANTPIVDGNGLLTQYGMLVFSSLLSRVSALEAAAKATKP